MGFLITRYSLTQESYEFFILLESYSIIEYLRNYFKKKVVRGVRYSQYIVVTKRVKSPKCELWIPSIYRACVAGFFAGILLKGGSMKAES